MNTKIVIFVALSTFLLMTIYSSSVFVAFGKEWNCNQAPLAPKGDDICTSRGGDGKITDVKYCYTDKNVGRVCIYITSTTKTQSANLDNAFNAGTLETQNIPKVPKTPKVPDDLGGLNTNNSG